MVASFWSSIIGDYYSMGVRGFLLLQAFGAVAVFFIDEAEADAAGEFSDVFVDDVCEGFLEGGFGEVGDFEDDVSG